MAVEWKTQLPSIPEDYGPSVQPTVIAAINEIRKQIDKLQPAGDS